MIKIEFKEPSFMEWQEWRQLCAKATDKLCKAQANGDPLDVDERLYKKMRDVYLSSDGPFHGKCVYCESFFPLDQPGDIDHFRPKAKVTDAGDNLVRLSSQHSNLSPHPDASLLSTDDIKDLMGLVRILSHPTPDALSNYIWSHIPPAKQTELQTLSLNQTYRKSILVNALNTLLQGELIYETARFADVGLTPETQALMAQSPTGAGLLFLNRMLLTEAYPVEVAGIPHPGYYWLAYEWRNLLPACAKCNRPYREKPGETFIGKGTRFPVSGEYAVEPGAEDHEKPLLINPASDNPDDHPSLHIEIVELGILIARTERGDACIKVFGLNDRPPLVAERGRVFYDALDAVTTYADAIRAKDTDRANRAWEKLEAFRKGCAAYSLAGRTGMRLGGSKEHLRHSQLLQEQSQLVDTLAMLAAPPGGL